MSTRLASPRERQVLILRLQELGIRDGEQQRHVCRVWARRHLASRKDLTSDEASSLRERLRTITREELAAVLARPAPEPQPAEPTEEELAAVLGPLIEPQPAEEPAPAAVDLPAGVIVCGPGQVTDHDAATVRAFAVALEEGLVAVHAFALAEDPTPPAGKLEPAPVDVETAAEAAVARFRERLAAGITPAPPTLSDIPPRVPLVLGPAPGRYCMPPPATCYCGECEHWQPAPPVDYSKIDGTKAHAEAHGKSWANRQGGTWIDQL